MEHRFVPRLGRPVSVVGLGCWQLGADWGEVTESDALAVLHAAADDGVTFFDTADVYGDGRSEQVIARFLSGVPYDVGIRDAAELASFAPDGSTAAQAALRWIIDQPGVSTVIPGARSVEQVHGNCAVGSMAPMPAEYGQAVRRVYDRDLRALLHSRW